MITRLEVDGFKSLRNFAIDLAPFTALVGPNSAGKSNILEALALLSHLASEPIEAAFKHGRGRAIDQFTLEKGEAVRTIRLAAEVLLPTDVEAGSGPTNRLRYELTIARERLATGAESLVIEHERLSTIDEEHDGWAREHSAFAARVHHASEEREVLRHIETSPKDSRTGWRRIGRGGGEESQLWLVPDTHTALVQATRWTVLVEGPSDLEWMRHLPQTAKLDSPMRTEKLIAAVLSLLRLVRLDTSSLHGESERIGGAALAPDASNLPTVLATLSPRLLGEIRADLVALVPGISTFDLIANDDSLRIEIELSGGDRLPARLVSDGTLRALALLTALRSTPSPSVIAIEEPENGIYPGRLRTLLDLLREASADRSPPRDMESEEDGPRGPPPQVIITSHSPVVLAAMRDDLAGLRFIDTVRRDGHLTTRARKVGPSAPGERGQKSVPLREIDALLSLAASEAAE